MTLETDPFRPLSDLGAGAIHAAGRRTGLPSQG